MYASHRRGLQLQPCSSYHERSGRLGRGTQVSHSHYDGLLVLTGIRIDVGGKLLTNQLKELVSFRQWNMMDETYIMNHVKESCCLVSSNFKHDLEVCRWVLSPALLVYPSLHTPCRADPKGNSIVREYVLPDLTQNKQGWIRQPGDIVTDNDQVLVMNNERFTVPELLFRPDDIG